jgi:hypothetical protein
MLAYLDDILEPEDADDIGKKIAESDFANSLVHRTRDCVHRQRLGTPALAGKGLAADANTVAEYLDNTLEGERVPEFEKVCLESDVHLAEVASCHQILTLVLGEPAEINAASRERMYQLVHQEEAGTTTDEQAEPTKQLASRQPPVAAVPSNGRRHRPEIPDYLRESEKARRWPLVSTIAIAALVTLAILLVAGPPGLRQQVTALFAGGGQPKEASADGQREPIAMPGKEASEPREPESTATDDTPTQAPAETTAPEQPAAESRTPTPANGVEPTVEPSPTPAPQLILPRPTDELPAGADGVPPVPSDSPADRPLPAHPEDETPKEAAPMPSDLSIEPEHETPAAPEVKEDLEDARASNPLRPAKPLDIAAAAGAEVGRYLTDTEVAATFDRGHGAWQRLSPRAVLAAGDQVVSLPSYRPAFGLVNGVTIETAGPSLMTFEGLDGQGIPLVNVEFGRLRMLTVGKAGNQVHLRLGSSDVVLTFVDAQSTLALEVVNQLPPGTDPETGPRELAVDLYATSGQIAYGKTGEEDSVKAFNHVSLTQASADKFPEGQLPEWTTRNVLAPLDEKAAEALERELPPDRPLGLAIKEASQNRRAEVRALAIRAGAYLGDFDAFVSALNDTDQRASWAVQVEALKAAVARGPQTASLVRQTLEQQRGADAKLLYRMLWGYTADQLVGGEAQNLVDALNSESLDIRVLSFWNLQHITGVSLFYRPEYPEAKRRSSLTKWRERLNDGKIVPLSETSMRAPTHHHG